MVRKAPLRPLLQWGVGPLPNARAVLQLTFAGTEEGAPARKLSVRVSLTAAQAREIADGLQRMADATVMGQTPFTPPSVEKN